MVCLQTLTGMICNSEIMFLKAFWFGNLYYFFNDQEIEVFDKMTS